MTDSVKRLNKAAANEKTAAASAQAWVAMASGYSHEGRSERGAATRKSPRKAKRGLSKARRRLDRAVIGVELDG